MAEADLARRGAVAVSRITGECARLLRAGRRRISLASAIIVAAGLLATWGVAGPAAAAVTTPVVKTTSLPMATAGLSYSAKLAATGGIAPYTWSVTAGALPAGLTLVPATGLIAGIPAAGSSAGFTVQATDSENPSLSASAKLSITVNLIPLAVTTTALPPANGGISYSAKLAAAGGVAPYTWSVTAGGLPAGLILNAATGAISGKPTAPGTASFTVSVSDGETPSASVSAALSVSVAVAPLAISTAPLSGATADLPYSLKLAASGGIAPYNVTVTVTDDTELTTGVAAFAWTVNQNPVTVTNPGGQVSLVNTFISLQFVASDSDAGQTLAYSATGLPAGLSINPNTGLISGALTTPGGHSVTVTVTDGTGASESAAFTWTVLPGRN